jgi:hypothetical protein
MSVSSPLGSIEALEERLFCVSEALKNGDVEDLVPRIAEFHALVVAFASGQALEQGAGVLLPTAETTARLKALGAALGQVREQLARRHGLVEQALKMVIPATQMPVYAKQSGPYGAGARSSGRLQTLTA